MLIRPVIYDPIRSVMRDPLGASIGFYVGQLFANGEQGVWYDPSDFSTLFQDAAGTIPVTAVEQPVGRILDKRLGLVRGIELVTNGTFDTASGWTTGTNWAISGGLATHTASAAGALTCTSATIVPGVTYEIVFTISNWTAGTITARLGSGGVEVISPNFGANGVFRCVLTANAGNTQLLFVAASTFSGSIDDVSCKELPGNHASQATAAARPVLSARKNLLLNSAFNGGGAAPTTWVQGSGTGTSAPAGNIDGNVIYRQVAVAQRPYLQAPGIAMAANQVTALSAYVDTLHSGTLSIEQFVTWSTLPAGAVVTYFINGVSVLGTASVASGNRATAVITLAATAGSPVARVGVGVSSNTTADASFSRPQVEFGPTATRYQRVNTATDYDSVGFPRYLKFDGVDDFLVTGSINFTATDKMTVWAGVTKLSDAALAGLIELSSDSAVNNGTFAIFAPVSAAPNFRFRSRGTLTSDVTPTPFAAPFTAVLTQIGDIANDVSSARVNGIQSAAVSDQGTGNYGNYPIYIGRRGGTSAPFNGQINQLIIRGAASSTTQIEYGEDYVASKTGVPLP